MSLETAAMPHESTGKTHVKVTLDPALLSQVRRAAYPGEKVQDTIRRKLAESTAPAVKS